MKKFINITLLLALPFLFFVTGCKKEDTIESVIQKSEKIPIAKLTDNNEIEHLFLQKDVQTFFSTGNSDFSKGNSDGELVFIEVIDDEKNGEDAGLLYRIYYGEHNVAETSIINDVITFEDGIYYYALPGGGTSKTSCTTVDCASSSGCQPLTNSTCSPCKNGGKCERRTTFVTAIALAPLTDAIQYAVSIY